MFVSTLFVCNGNHINHHFEIFGCSLYFVSSKSNFGFNIQHNLNNSLPWDVNPSIILLLTILKLNWVRFALFLFFFVEAKSADFCGFQNLSGKNINLCRNRNLRKWFTILCYIYKSGASLDRVPWHP
jgi:hypothetical protein